MKTPSLLLSPFLSLSQIEGRRSFPRRRNIPSARPVTIVGVETEVILKAHQPTGGSSVAHGEDRAPPPVQKSSEFLQLQQRVSYNDDLLGRYLSQGRINPDSIGLSLVIGK